MSEQNISHEDVSDCGSVETLSDHLQLIISINNELSTDE